MLTLIVTLAVLGLILYCINLLPIAEPFKTIIYVVFVIIAIYMLLGFIGVLPAYSLR